MLIYDVLYYIYVFLFGTYVSLRIALGVFALREWRLFATACPALLILQGVLLQTQGVEHVWALYPLIAHLPLLLILVGLCRIDGYRAAVSVAIAYALCQLLRWVGLVIGVLSLAPTATLVLHLSVCHALFLLLDRYVLGAIHDILCSDASVRGGFGALPVIYYLYDYFMRYTMQRYADEELFRELLPTATVLSFILFAIVYQRELSKGNQAQCHAQALELELQYAQHEIALLRTIQEKTAIYRHDLRHHLSMLGSLIAADRQEQALSYIRRTESEIDTLVPTRYCENETVNLLLSSFNGKAKEQGVNVSIRAALPQALALPDTELCTLLLNGLENACAAASALPEGASRTISVLLDVRQNNLLLEIRNPYAGEITMRDGLPLAASPERHYGCRSIQSIAHRRKGICTFHAQDGVFTLRIAIPLRAA